MKEQNVEKSEFELGEEVTELVQRPRRKPGVVISVRIEADDAKRLFALAEKRDQTVSDVAREAIDSLRSRSASATTRERRMAVPRWSSPGVETA